MKELENFYKAVTENPRFGTSHIALYMALFYCYMLNGFQNPVAISRTLMMPLAKIHGLATYHKCMRDLAESGYIQYIPSYNPSIKSLVCILALQ